MFQTLSAARKAGFKGTTFSNLEKFLAANNIPIGGSAPVRLKAVRRIAASPGNGTLAATVEKMVVDRVQACIDKAIKAVEAAQESI